MAYLHTPQICRTCRGVKAGIHGLLNWTAENLYLGKTLSKNRSCCGKRKRILPIAIITLRLEIHATISK
jgi:hypothetical protein